MGRVTYVEPSGACHDIDLEDGESVMEGAVNNGLPGIDADCGGACACATCHVHIDEAWMERLDPAASGETEMLADFASNITPQSRLGCQLKMSERINGLVVHLLESQR